VHFSFKIRHLVATVLVIFLKINLQNFVQAYRYDTSLQRSDYDFYQSREVPVWHTVPLGSPLRDGTESGKGGAGHQADMLYVNTQKAIVPVSVCQSICPYSDKWSYN